MVYRMMIHGSALAALLLLLLLTQSPPVSAGEKPPSTNQSLGVAHAAAAPASSWWERLYTSLESALRDSQKRMVQFCLVGMLLCLWVIWWRK